MFVAATTRCFAGLPLEEALVRLSDLEFSNVEIVLDEEHGPIRPSQVADDLDSAIAACRATQRLNTVAYCLQTQADDEEYFRQFTACCRLAKATQVVTIVVRALELGTPFNAEIERLQRLVRIATGEGAVVSLLTEVGTMTDSPETAAVLCKTVKGLRLTIDLSYLIFRRETPLSMEPVLPYVQHVHLRDTLPDEFQVRVGQGHVEYGKLLSHLSRYQYDRALSVDILPNDEVDQNAELRKFRLLLESLL